MVEKLLYKYSVFYSSKEIGHGKWNCSAWGALTVVGIREGVNSKLCLENYLKPLIEGRKLALLTFVATSTISFTVSTTTIEKLSIPKHVPWRCTLLCLIKWFQLIIIPIHDQATSKSNSFCFFFSFTAWTRKDASFKVCLLSKLWIVSLS